MKMPIQILVCFGLFFNQNLKSQQTVGLFLNSKDSFNGYTLFGNNEISYLIDNCGFIINTWKSDFDPGNSMYLLENGDLLRSARIAGAFNAGGTGGRFERFNWDGDLIWSYQIANNQQHAHHDIVPMRNGNFLAIVWELHSNEDAKQNGSVHNGEVWSEKIVEVHPVGSNQAIIVWEWKLWDHLIQHADSGKANFGVISDNPQLVDINYRNENNSSADWVHLNSIYYNEDLDQIVLSSRNFNEIWVIDHSTTTEEASGHSGGRRKKGGDLLYRYGNPQAYQQGNFNDQKFFGQHDARWIPAGFPNEGKLMVFNNKFSSANASRIEIWQPPIDTHGNYILEKAQSYGPEENDWSYSMEGFYSEIMSGAEVLINGNILICEGSSGHFFEIKQNGELVWEYINPVNKNGFPVLQGGMPRFNECFRIKRYSIDYQAFVGKSIFPTIPVELAPWENTCEIHDITSAGFWEVENNQFKLLQNPVRHIAYLENNSVSTLIIKIFDIQSQFVFETELPVGFSTIDLSFLTSGLYIVASFIQNKLLKGEKIIIQN